VPYTAAGPLKIVASSELGGLGAKDGLPVEYNWVLPGVGPLLLPWLAVLGLLALKPNRRAAAWLIWLPLGGVVALMAMPNLLPSHGDFLLDSTAALVFGLAAVWLLSNYLHRSHRALTFLCILFTLGGASLLGLMAHQGWNLLEADALPTGLLLIVGVLATTVALALDGWICRRRYRPVGVYLWLFLLLIVIWLALTAPFFLFALVASSGSIAWSEFFVPVLGMAVGNFALLLPFLILSSASSFFRERLQMLLHLQTEIPPQLIPTPEIALKT